MRRPVGRKRPARRGGEGIEPERHGAVGRARARSLDQRGEAQRLARRRSARDRVRNAGRRRSARRRRPRAGSPDRTSSSPKPWAPIAPAKTTARPSAPPARSSSAWALASLASGWSRRAITRHGPDGPQRPGAVRRRIERLDARFRRPSADARLVEALALQRRLGGLAPVGFAPGGKDRRVRAQGRHSSR